MGYRVSARVRLAATIGAAVLLAALGTHLVAAALEIQTTAATGHKRFGRQDGQAQALISGSSLTYDAVNWSEVAEALDLSIESWPVPGSSPAEWEQLQRRSPQAGTTFVGVSLYDLNEAWLCDFRADIVPFRRTLTDLWESGSDLAFAKRLSNWYALTWARTVFPTAGRSDRVIFGLRDKAAALLSVAGRPEEAGAKLRLAADYTSEARLTDWPEGRLLRRLDSMRSLQGKANFAGPKHLALLRLLQQARRQGDVVVVVLPVSPPYAAGLLSRPDIEQFESALSKAKRAVPEATWVRLDQLETLNSADHFYDLVHLNMQGRSIATAALLGTLAGTPAAQ